MTQSQVQNEKKYKLYSLNTYAKTIEFINNCFEEYCIDNLLKKLNNDNCYYLRIQKGTNYIFFGDCDGFNGTFNEFSEILVDFLEQCYDIKVFPEEISYTVNNAKIGSFHYSIPKLYASCEKLKEMHVKLLEKHSNDLKNNRRSAVDLSTYTNKWFRYPLQTKADDTPGRHIIQHGDMIDFVIEHLPNESMCINDKKYIDDENDNNENENNNNENTIPTKSKETDPFKTAILKKILSAFTVNVYDDRCESIKIGMALKNESSSENYNDYFNMWNDWLCKSTKCNDAKYNRKVWNDFVKTDCGYKMEALLHILKNDNTEEYEKISKYNTFHDLIVMSQVA